MVLGVPEDASVPAAQTHHLHTVITEAEQLLLRLCPGKHCVLRCREPGR